VFDGGYGLEFTGTSTRPITGNTIQMGEVRGGKCVFSNFATNNVVKNVGFVGPRPTQGSLFGVWGDSKYGPPVADQPVITNFAGNPGIEYPPNTSGDTVRFARLLDGWTEHD